MSNWIKITALTLTIAAGATTANADSLLKDLASTGSIVTTHGIAGPR